MQHEDILKKVYFTFGGGRGGGGGGRRRLVVSDKKSFSCFLYISLYKTCDPRAGPFLTPRALFEQT